MNTLNAKKIALLAMPFGLIWLMTGVTRNTSAQTPILQPTTATSTAASAAAAPAPAFAAMAYYDQNCAHCHGPLGTFYGPTLGHDLNDEQLQKKVDMMARGPGNAPLTADQLPAETAFHRALIMRTPFLSVTQMGSDGQWAGEAMPDAKIVLLVGGQKIEATSDDSAWTAKLPPNTKPSDVKISAELNGTTTTLSPADSSYSNTTPLPPADARPK